MAKLMKAYWTGPSEGIVLLTENWNEASPPPVTIASEKRRLINLRRAPQRLHAELCGFYANKDSVTFALDAARYPQINPSETPVYVAGGFNQWGNRDRERWRLRRVEGEPGKFYSVTVSADEVFSTGNAVEFKFVSENWNWLYPNYHAPNLSAHTDGICNYQINRETTGDHCFVFEIEGPRAIGGEQDLVWNGDGGHEAIPIDAGMFFYELESEGRVGSWVEGTETVFRLFAPRARSVTLEWFRNLDESDLQTVEMAFAADEVTWECRVPENLDGSYYFFRVAGKNIGGATHFNPDFRVLDPWARATVGHAGPGIVIHDERFTANPPKPFQTPRWNDIVACEAHVRDLTRHSPVEMSWEERQDFRGLRRYIETEGNYLADLGVNAVELQPVQQFDSHQRNDYHWGYMTTNYFSPCCHYGSDPAQASQIDEFRELVDACHARGLAVILDVVYNHVGEPNFLLHIDKQYYFDITKDGKLMNWSGCGNTLRADAAMSKRLIIESLSHLVQAYGVDGFRFDLGELIGVTVLKEIEKALRALKPDVILVAEPWSFRGHIARELKHTGWAFWNDGYREFLPNYVLGKGNFDGITYFMSGCIAYLTGWPSQSVNYVESHDDRTFLDKITENRDKNGFHPTDNDRKRSHMMVGVLMASLGIPMLSAGQSFMRSKHGKNNTYLDGDENALDYNRIHEFESTHHYFRSWIKFRLGEFGKVFRLRDLPGDGYSRFWSGGDGRSGVAAWWNVDGRMGDCQVLFAVNPNPFEHLTLRCGGLATGGWRQIADLERFHFDGFEHMCLNHDVIELEPLSLALFVKKKAPDPHITLLRGANDGSVAPLRKPQTVSEIAGAPVKTKAKGRGKSEPKLTETKAPTPSTPTAPPTPEEESAKPAPILNRLGKAVRTWVDRLRRKGD